MIKFKYCSKQDLLLLGLWILIGAGLRLINLGLKSPATIEISTLIFSLGNSVSQIPLDQVISLETILQPLHLSSDATLISVFQNLMKESTHPPLYFLLTHLWLKLFSVPGELVSLWGARLLATLWGIITIPTIFYLSLRLFKFPIISHLAAILMAVSPYGIFIAQQARHYTLPVFLILISLGCFMIAIQRLKQGISLPLWISLIWVIVNSFGFATHYFFGIAILAEGLVTLPLLWQQTWQQRQQNLKPIPATHIPIYLAMVGTFLGCLIWLPFLNQASDSELTNWIYEGKSFGELLEPIPRLIAWLITMFALLPVEGVPAPLLILSATVLGIFSVWALIILIRGCRHQWHHLQPNSHLKTLVGFLVAVLLIFLGLIYGAGADLSLAARYQFVYFPAIILLIAISLSVYWQNPQPLRQFFRFWQSPKLLGEIDRKTYFTGGSQVIMLILVMGLLGSLSVVYNFGFQKSQRSDLLISQILAVQESQRLGVPVLIAMVHQTHAETRAIIELGWEFQEAQKLRQQPLPPLQFLLAQKEEDSPMATQTLHKILNQLPKPLDLWTVNFKSAVNPEEVNCVEDEAEQPDINGYDYDLYHCGL